MEEKGGKRGGRAAFKGSLERKGYKEDGYPRPAGAG